MKTYQQYYKYAKTLAQKWKHTKSKIQEKLFNKGASAALVEKIVSSLERQRIINDRKVFELEVFCLEEKRYGYRRVKDTLASKGYSVKFLDEYIFNKDIERDNCVFYFLRGIKKYKNYKYSDDEREKLINYLKRYGFNDKMIHEVMKAGIDYENVE